MLIWWCEPTWNGGTRVRIRDVSTGRELSLYLSRVDILNYEHYPEVFWFEMAKLERRMRKGEGVRIEG